MNRLWLLLFVAVLFANSYSQTADDFFEQGNKKLKLQDYNGAFNDFSKAIELNPNYVKAYNNRGISQSILNNNPSAIEDFNKAISIDETNISALKNRGLSKYQLQDYAGAAADFNKVLQLKPTDEQTIKKLQLSLNQLQLIKNNKEADNQKTIIEKENSVLVTSPTINEVHKKNQLKVKKEDLNNTLYSRDKSFNYKAMYESYSKDIELDSTNAQAYYKRGLLKASLRNYKGDDLLHYESNMNYTDKYQDAYTKGELLKGDYGAIADFTKAIQLKPAFADAYYARGFSLYSLKQLKSATADFSKAIEINPALADAYYYRGLAKGVSNDPGGACLDFIKAKELGNLEAEDLADDCK